MQNKEIEIVLPIDQHFEVRTELKEQNPIVEYEFWRRAASTI